MAYQHFYSRVPARTSMYEKADGYDTFIKSENITKEYISVNLLPFCNIKITNNEMNLIRDGKLSPAYAQYLSKNGEDLIQSAISYIPLDFTGERSAYMVHSLVFSNEERIKVVSSNKNGLINVKLFNTDINNLDAFSLTSRPIEDYSEQIYVGDRSGVVEEFITKYSPTVVKRLLFAILCSVTNKGKPVYITLNVPLEELSSEALKLMNTIIQVFPYHIRNKISFISFLTDISRYNNLIKIKFLPKECLNIPAGKGYQFDMTSKMIDGIRDEEYKAKEVDIEFLYELLGNKVLRDKFLTFYANIVKENEKLSNPDLNDFSGIVLLFRQSSGAYNEKLVIPEDKDVMQLLTTYESFRNYMKEKDRCEILKCIQRYATKRMIIPQNIFTKVQKLYGTEPGKCKTTVMAIILDLIHTDVMRDKLFSFIKTNYGKENQRNRSIISEDLSRVFYGGFLQPQIIGLFNTYYLTETNNTKTIILEKVLLAIRTQSIQDKIIDFLNTFYENFNNIQKDLIYKAFYDNIPENDSLTKKIISFIDNHYDNEQVTYKKKIATNICLLIEADEKKKNKGLLDVVLLNKGPLEKIMINKIFTDWQSRNAFVRYLSSLDNMNFIELSETLIKIWSYSYQMSLQIEKKLFDKTIEIIDSMKKVTLYQIISFDDSLYQVFTKEEYPVIYGIDKDSLQRIITFYNKLKEEKLKISIIEHLLDSLNPKLNKEGISFILDYSENNSYIKDTENYRLIKIVYDSIQLIQEKKITEFLDIFINNEIPKNVKQLMILSLRTLLNDMENMSYTKLDYFQTAIAIGGIYEFLDSNEFKLDKIFSYCFEKRKDFLIENSKVTQVSSKKDINFDSVASVWVVEYISNLCLIILSTSNNQIINDSIYTIDDNQILKMMSIVCTKLDKEGTKQLYQLVSSLKVKDPNLSAMIEKGLIDYKKNNSKGLFAKIFGKK